MNCRVGAVFGAVMFASVAFAAPEPPRASFISLAQPCRIFDTRLTGEGRLTAAAPRHFKVRGTAGFPEQGGTEGGCGIPPEASAAVINFIAVSPVGPGNIKGSAFPNPIPATGSIINYQALTPSLNIANAVQFPVCSERDCEFDITLQPNGADVHVVGDVLGYYVLGVVSSISAGTGLIGGGTGTVGIAIAPQGVGAGQLAPSAVTTGAIQDGAVTGAKIANNQVVRSINNVTDLVTLAGSGGTTVNTAGSTITINAVAASAPKGTVILGPRADTTIIGAGYQERGRSDLVTWRGISSNSAPANRYGHAAVWTGSKMIVWGGRSLSGFENTGGIYDPVTDSWTPTSTTTPPAPSGRWRFPAVWTGTVMVVWGGFGLSGHTGDGSRFDPVLNQWEAMEPFGAPTPREQHTAVWDHTTVIIWGGINAAATFENTGARYRPSNNDWAPTSMTNAPTARSGHTAVWTGSEMIVWGGIDQLGITNTGGRYNPATPTQGSWSATSMNLVPAGRAGHTAVWTGTEMIVWGGGEVSGGSYPPAFNFWRQISATGAPPGQTGHTAVWTGESMIVWGGGVGSVKGIFESFNTGGQYDLSVDSWSSVNVRGAPSPRMDHTAVWTGSEMIVFGGSAKGLIQPGGGGATPLWFYQKE